jgi:polar amino acid transport system substrate-binding protein
MQMIRFIVLVLLFSAPVAWAGEAATEIPVLFALQTDPNGKPLPATPFITEMVKLLGAESGLKLVLQQYPWRRAQKLAENGEGLLYGLAATPERQRELDFTLPLYHVNQWLIVPANRAFSFQEWEDLRGKVISIQSGGKFNAQFEEQRNKLFRVEEHAETYLSRFKMLQIGRVDAILMDNYRTATQLEARLNCQYAEVGKWIVLSKPVDMEPVLIAVAKSSRYNHLLPALNEAISRIEKTQRIQKLLMAKAAKMDC